MKKIRQDYIKISLTVAVIAGMFMPYVYGVWPIGILFDDYMELENLFALTIPILVTIPFLLILIFKSVMRDSLVRVLKVFFLLIYIMVLANYGYFLYESVAVSVFDEQFPTIASMVLSLLLILLSLKYAVPKSERLEHIMLAILTIPIIFYFTYGITNHLENLNYGSYIISISFILLYIMAIHNIYKNRNEKSQLNSLYN